MSSPLFLLQTFPLSEWDFGRNCSAAAHFFQESRGDLKDACLNTIVAFLRGSLPSGFNTTTFPPSELDAALVQWSWVTPIPQQQLDLASAACRADICPLLGWPAEPDVAGIGVRMNPSSSARI